MSERTVGMRLVDLKFSSAGLVDLENFCARAPEAAISRDARWLPQPEHMFLVCPDSAGYILLYAIYVVI